MHDAGNTAAVDVGDEDRTCKIGKNYVKLQHELIFLKISWNLIHDETIFYNGVMK